MFYYLPSLDALLLKWGATRNGRDAIQSVPTDPQTDALISNLKNAGRHAVGQVPSANGLAGAILALTQ